MPEIVLRNLYNPIIGNCLKGVSLNLPWELLTLMGPSGCGKTTTLKILAGLIAPEQGKVLIDGRDITFLPIEKRDVVMMFQENMLFPHMTVGENITFGLRMAGCSKLYQKNKLIEMLELVQLPDLKNRYPAQLSGGQQQRVVLARAVALEPKILLLDEPLSNLDSHLRDEVRELILEIHKKMKMNIIMVTHDKLDAMLMGDRIAVMSEGKIVQCDIPYKIYNQPATWDVANLFGPCNVMSGVVRNGKFKTKGHEFDIPDIEQTGEVVAFIRPEAIELVDSEPDITGVVVENKYTGGCNLLKVNTRHSELLVRTEQYGHADVAVNTSVGLRIHWEKAGINKIDTNSKSEYCQPQQVKQEVKGFVSKTVAAEY